MRHSLFCYFILSALVGCSGSPGAVGGIGPGGGGPGGLRLDAGVKLTGVGDARRVITNDGRGPGSTAPGELIMVVRDFRFYDLNDPSTVADFENVPITAAPTEEGWSDPDIVTTTLGPDFKPVYANPTGNTLTTHGKAAFDKWYRNVEGTNIAQQIPLNLSRDDAGNFAYNSATAGLPLSPGGGFFPIDDGTTYATKFGNQGQNHNFSFTVEIHTVFTYKGGEVFNFSGDDDVFVFINNQLVINLGGIHRAQRKDVALDTLGLTKGQTYALDFFSAERHVVQSNILITTTLELSTNPDAPIF